METWRSRDKHPLLLNNHLTLGLYFQAGSGPVIQKPNCKRRSVQGTKEKKKKKNRNCPSFRPSPPSALNSELSLTVPEPTPTPTPSHQRTANNSILSVAASQTPRACSCHLRLWSGDDDDDDDYHDGPDAGSMRADPLCFFPGPCSPPPPPPAFPRDRHNWRLATTL